MLNVASVNLLHIRSTICDMAFPEPTVPVIQANENYTRVVDDRTAPGNRKLSAVATATNKPIAKGKRIESHCDGPAVVTTCCVSLFFSVSTQSSVKLYTKTGSNCLSV